MNSNKLMLLDELIDENRMLYDVLDRLVTHTLGVGGLDDDTMLWREVAALTNRDPVTGNRK
jgi:hypothetical protein